MGWAPPPPPRGCPLAPPRYPSRPMQTTCEGCGAPREAGPSCSYCGRLWPR